MSGREGLASRGRRGEELSIVVRLLQEKLRQSGIDGHALHKELILR